MAELQQRRVGGSSSAKAKSKSASVKEKKEEQVRSKHVNDPLEEPSSGEVVMHRLMAHLVDCVISGILFGFMFLYMWRHSFVEALAKSHFEHQTLEGQTVEEIMAKLRGYETCAFATASGATWGAFLLMTGQLWVPLLLGLTTRWVALDITLLLAFGPPVAALVASFLQLLVLGTTCGKFMLRLKFTKKDGSNVSLNTILIHDMLYLAFSLVPLLHVVSVLVYACGPGMLHEWITGVVVKATNIVGFGGVGFKAKRKYN